MKKMYNFEYFRVCLLLSLLINGSVYVIAQRNTLSHDDLLSTSLSSVFRPNLDYKKTDLFRSASITHAHQTKNMGEFQLHTAFFCKIEDRIEKQSQIPFRFRLGSLNYVNMLENKVKDFIFVGYQH